MLSSTFSFTSSVQIYLIVPQSVVRRSIVSCSKRRRCIETNLLFYKHLRFGKISTYSRRVIRITSYSSRRCVSEISSFEYSILWVILLRVATTKVNRTIMVVTHEKWQLFYLVVVALMSRIYDITCVFIGTFHIGITLSSYT